MGSDQNIRIGIPSTGDSCYGSLNSQDRYGDFIYLLSKYVEYSYSREGIVLGKYRRILENDQVLGDRCPICLEEYKEGFYKRTLECRHTYHKKCIDRWFRKQYNNCGELVCPICRYRIGTLQNGKV